MIMKLLNTPYFRPSARLFQLSLLGAALLTASCGTIDSQPTSTPLALDNSLESADILLTNAVASAQSGDLGAAASDRLRAGQILVDNGQLTTAERVFSDIKPTHLTESERIRYSLAYSDLALTVGEYYIAKRVLDEPSVEALLPAMSAEQKQRWRTNRAGTYTLTGEPILAIGEYMAMTPLLTNAQEQQANSDQIWLLLMTLPDKTLSALSQKEPDPTLRGWYTLAALSKNNQANLEQQLTQVTAWQQQWRGHPAANYPPQDLQLLERLVLEQPRHVALLLPLTGKLASAGKAVRDGFMAAYYSAKTAGQQTPTVRVYNTDQADINAVYQTAVAAGAETVIGPLQKDLIQTLNSATQLPVPTLSLNYVLGESNQTDNLYQFGLAPEDEARQIAERAWRDGHRHAMVLSSDRAWGQRSAAAFIEAWRALGGHVAVFSEFSLQRNFSKVVERSLLVDRSKQRAYAIENMMGIDMVTQPRSRGDIDMVFMIAQPEDARQLKPTLAFHYAGNIPVYATSHLFNPDAGRSANSDLNGIRFTSLPWNFGFAQYEHDQLAQWLPNQRSLQNLQALGVDAYRLYPRVLQFKQISHSRYYGATGELYLTPEGRIARRQSLAIIKRGEAELLPALSDDIGVQ